MIVSSYEFNTAVKSLPPDVDKMLEFCTEQGCSDLFIKVGEPSMLYRYGILYQTQAAFDSISWNKFVNSAITSELNARYVRDKMVDFSYTLLKKKYRYRVNAGFSTGKNIATFRVISERLPSFSSLKLGKDVVSLLEKAWSEKQGISLLCGATGSGKTSTLAACINSFSSGYSGKEALPLKDAHLITLEDPIEYIYPTISSTRVIQKELGKDFMSFELGIKSALREHPTHILVGETRDKNTISALVHASMTGHSTFSTFHCSTVAETMSRIHSYLTGENQEIMFDLVSNMNFILCQRLIKGRKGVTLSYQYMFFTNEIRKVLTEALYKGLNIPRVVENLMANEQLLKTGACSGWKNS